MFSRKLFRRFVWVCRLSHFGLRPNHGWWAELDSRRQPQGFVGPPHDFDPGGFAPEVELEPLPGPVPGCCCGGGGCCCGGGVCCGLNTGQNWPMNTEVPSAHWAVGTGQNWPKSTVLPSRHGIGPRGGNTPWLRGVALAVAAVRTMFCGAAASSRWPLSPSGLPKPTVASAVRAIPATMMNERGSLMMSST
jgi:hypothetical protein